VHIRARNNTIIVEPNYEVLKRIDRFASTGEEIDTKEFGKVKVNGSQDYVNTNPGKILAWGTVKSVGPGAAWMGGKHRLDRELRKGDIIGFDAFAQVSLNVQGEKEFFLPVDQALCRFNPDQEMPEPIGVYVMTKEEPDALKSITFKDPNIKLHLPGGTGEVKVSDNPWGNVKWSVERILAVGKGGMAHSEIRTERSSHERVTRKVVMRDGREVGSEVISTKIIDKVQTPVWIQPDPEAVGKLALFMFTMSVDMLVHGVRHRFTNWDKIRGTVEDE
jgi:hypothetical protein